MKYFENYNDACQNCDIITKKTDMFSHETIVLAEKIIFKCGADYYDFLHPDDSIYWESIPLIKGVYDLQYKSSPQGEEFSIDYDRGGGPDVMIININMRDNVRLEKRGTDFSIKKQDFIKCCEAKTIRFQLRYLDNVVYENSSSQDDMILFFQALYNEVIDDTKYQDAKEILNAKCKKKLEEYRQWRETQEKAKDELNKMESKNKTALTVVGIVLAVLGFIFLIPRISSGSGGLMTISIIFLFSGLGMFAYGLAK